MSSVTVGVPLMSAESSGTSRIEAEACCTGGNIEVCGLPVPLVCGALGSMLEELGLLGSVLPGGVLGVAELGLVD